MVIYNFKLPNLSFSYINSVLLKFKHEAFSKVLFLMQHSELVLNYLYAGLYDDNFVAFLAL